MGGHLANICLRMRNWVRVYLVVALREAGRMANVFGLRRFVRIVRLDLGRVRRFVARRPSPRTKENSVLNMRGFDEHRHGSFAGRRRRSNSTPTHRQSKPLGPFQPRVDADRTAMSSDRRASERRAAAGGRRVDTAEIQCPYSNAIANNNWNAN
ncbi:hypothetical protein [Burkholderia savannae]|uniref:hypothetical protein n=1 Tax=Burkholderia savannae TaxID=1637837 RepID=UPI0012F4B139|nr:hypothetical protein [Burkholderia savannae]